MLAHGAQQTSGSGSGSGSVQQSGSSSSNGLKGLSYAAGSATEHSLCWVISIIKY